MDCWPTMADQLIVASGAEAQGGWVALSGEPAHFRGGRREQVKVGSRSLHTKWA